MSVEQKQIGDIFRVLVKRWPIIVGITLFLTACAGLVSYFVLPQEYQATAKVLVNELDPETAAETGDAATSFYQMETSFKLFETFMVIAQSPQVLDQVIDNLSLSDSYSELSEKVTIDRVGESLVIEIKANAENQNEAVNVVNETAKVLNQEITKIYGENQISLLETGGEADVMSPVKPKPFLNMIVAFLAGLVISMGIALLVELFKKPKIEPVKPQAANGSMYNGKLFTK
ncbi:YveK family protein [Domibacillus tundrae]|uniref:YveK family protein n=1 Tax=Domibacillus tundrae TaxID=1587527 RepID=UPI003390F9F9